MREKHDPVIDTIRDRVTEPSAHGIARAISALITSGVIEAGDQLPTVRATAHALGVSSSTISGAWRTLAHHGVIETDRRRGTTVRSKRASTKGRYWQVPVPIGTIDIDLSTGTPDHKLLPDVGGVLRRIHTDLAVGSYLDAPVLPDLSDVLRATWPFEPECVTVVDGALDALDRTIDALVRLGDRVVVEDPTFPPLLDMLELAGAEIIGVPVDEQGMCIDGLLAALDQRPTVVVTQPRAQNPTAISMSASRAKAVAEALTGSEIWLVEDDHSGDVAGTELHSVSALRPHRSVFIRSYSKSHGPDLRIAALGGDAEVVRTIEQRRTLGPAWTSRLIQQILLEMLRDPAVDAQIRVAADTYRERRTAFAHDLRAAGIEIGTGHGLNAWIPVNNEQFASVYLAAHSIGTAPGSPFMVSRSGIAHLRLSIGAYSGDMSDLADKVAAAAVAG